MFRTGDRIVIDGPEIVLEETDALCTHALASLLHYTTILDRDWCPVQLGLTTADDRDCAYIQCLDPGTPYTEGGTVVFQVKRLDRRES